MILNLHNIKEPKPTIPMYIVLSNLHRYGFITIDQFAGASNSYAICAEYIDKYQKAMHRYRALKVENKRIATGKRLLQSRADNIMPHIYDVDDTMAYDSDWIAMGCYFQDDFY